MKLDEMKKVWNIELDCACCRKNFRLGDMFAICADCYTLFLKAKKFMQNTHGSTDPSDISRRLPIFLESTKSLKSKINISKSMKKESRN